MPLGITNLSLPMKFACFSVAAMDYFPQQNCYCAGGNSLNQAIHLAKLGHETAFVGAVGQDAAGDGILKILDATGVDASHCVQLPGATASNRIINDSDGERFGEEGAWQDGVHAVHAFDSNTWQYLSFFDVWCTDGGDPHFRDTIEHKQRLAEPPRLCVDYLHLPDPGLLEQTLPHVDLAFVGGSPETLSLVEPLAHMHPERIVVVTLGAAGSIAYHRSKQWRQPALPIDKVLDTTGCGDAFQAAFTAAFFSSSGDIEKSLYEGAKSGRDNTRFFGAQPSAFS